MYVKRGIKFALAACAILSAAACAPPEGAPAETAEVGADRDKDWRDVDADLVKHPTLAALRTHYPEDYVRFVDDLMANFAADIAADPERTFADHRSEASEKSNEFIRTMFQREKVYTVNAPPERLQEWVRAYSTVLKTIQSERGAELCFDYVSKGGDALPADVSFMADEWNGMNAVLVNAMSEGRAKVKERVRATQEDFDAMTAWAIQSGVDEQLVKGMQSGTISDPKSTCDFMIGMTSSLAEMPDEVGDRMRMKVMLDILQLQQGTVTVIRN